MKKNLVARALNEVSLATWFGGSLMGAVGLTRGATEAEDHHTEVESAGWTAWQPLQTGAIVTQLASGAMLTYANRSRVVGQKGVAGVSALRTAVTVAAAGATIAAAREGAKVAEAHGRGDDAEADQHERRTHRLQWSVPALTGTLVVLDAVMGEQQRPRDQMKGFARRVLPEPVAEMLRAA